MSEKVYRCKIWTASYIHFRAKEPEIALTMVSHYFSDKQEVEVESIEEVDEKELEDTLIFTAAHLPDITIN